MQTITRSFSVSEPTTNGCLFLPIEAESSGTVIKGVIATQFMRFSLDMSAPERPAGLPGKSINTLVQKWEEDPRKAQALQRARARLSKEVETNIALSLAQLRLSKGLSQTKLAELMGCRQPYIARLETGEDDMKMSTIEKLATALGLPLNTIFSAVMRVRSARTTE
ncbi:helix-turn-helix domain-containing protein [Collimonas silvisoli]|uniref:helix-turn-helix domain-containing protein n=1 Tax=Collimonas silvisoli TaxID=2825884 RepID=UPI001B8D9E54|nr:helix-turn-helix transcriptional regulator [Collimonas silvisoli]